MANRVTRWLVVRGDGHMRLRASRPWGYRLRSDEIAFGVTVTFPDGWQKVYPNAVSLSFPEPPEPAVVQVDEEIHGEAGDGQEAHDQAVNPASPPGDTDAGR